MGKVRWALGCALAVALSPWPAAAVPVTEPAVEYRFFVYPDPVGTAEQGVVNVTSATRLATRAVEELAVHVWEQPADRAGIGALSRSLELCAMHAPAAIFASVLSHELLGHGARARELGFSPSYRLRPPPPYWFPTDGPYGSTEIGGRSSRLTLDELLLIDLGGLEADELQVREVAFSGFRSDAIRSGEVALYSVGRLHLLSMLPREGSDAYRFYAHAAARYGVDAGAVRRKLEVAAALSLIDPLLVYGWYATVARFIVRGQRAHGYPAIGLGEGTRLAGSYRPLPVPWGVEHQLEALVGGELGNLAMRVRIGDGVERGSLAASLDVRDVAVSEQFSLGAGVEIWSQPPLVLAPDLSAGAGGTAGVGVLGLGHPVYGDMAVGGAAVVLGEFRLEQWLWGLAIGAKSAGVQAGHPLAADAYTSAFGGVRL